LLVLTYAQFFFLRYFSITYFFFAFFFVVLLFVPFKHGSSYYPGFFPIFCIIAYSILQFETPDRFPLVNWEAATMFPYHYFPWFYQFFIFKVFYRRQAVWKEILRLANGRFNIVAYSRFR